MKQLGFLALSCVFALSSLAPANAQYQNNNYNYNRNNYGRYNVPQGSYVQSCTNIRVRGNRLSASCTSPGGQTVDSSIGLNQCGTNDIINSNGQLACGNTSYGNTRYGRMHHRYYNGYNTNVGALPPGSYASSCTNARLNGTRLFATCTAANGQQIDSSVNVSRCLNAGLDIRNNNGRLTC